MMGCSTKMNAAQRAYLRGGGMVMTGYILTVFGATAFVRSHPGVHGVERAVLALLPSLPIFIFMFVVGRYLRDERDEFERDIVVRSMLWGIAVVLCISCFTSFLKSYGWTGSVPPFMEFCGFWITVGIAKFAYMIANRTPPDE